MHRSHCSWFMFIERARFSLVMLRTAWLDSSCSNNLKAVLTDVALRGRDRMDTSYVAGCNGADVERVVLRMEYLLHFANDSFASVSGRFANVLSRFANVIF